MERNDPEMTKLIKAENDLDRRTQELARAYRDAPKDQRAKLKEDLKKVVDRAVRDPPAASQAGIDPLRGGTETAPRGTERREKNKQQIIEKRISDLLGEEADAGF